MSSDSEEWNLPQKTDTQPILPNYVGIEDRYQKQLFRYVKEAHESHRSTQEQ